ncbi:MAG: hypothetical protein GF330_03080 [Candidatus Eisenbacteria bacterium]|nr:hypothetical protein [Candidatus Eisenbacteria bacterium]
MRFARPAAGALQGACSSVPPRGSARIGPIMTDPSWETDSPLPFRMALDRILETARTIGIERIPIEAALGRIAARDLIAPIDVPAHPIALRDGYALCAGETRGAALMEPKRLRIVRQAFPETPATQMPEIAPDEAVQVATGAPMPPGADTVLTAERADARGDELLITAPVRAGSGILPAGGDVRRGTPIVSEGSALHPMRLGLLATTGLEHIEAFRVPRVGIVATGDEFPARPPSNLITLAAWCERFRFPVRHWVCRDDPPAIVHAVLSALRECDAVLTIGGTGPGSRDLIRDALGEIGWHTLVDGVQLRPGRTTRYGLARNKPVFALPGRPTANETAFLLLALPGLAQLAGSRARALPEVPARLARDLRRGREREQSTRAIKVHLYADDYFLHAVPLVGRALQKERGRLQAAAAGQGIVLLEEGDVGLRRGDVLPVLLLERSWA